MFLFEVVYDLTNKKFYRFYSLSSPTPGGEREYLPEIPGERRDY